MRSQKGFSRVELLIVVASILIMAAIAISKLMRSKMAANEASAALSERTINTAELTYANTYHLGFANFDALITPKDGCRAPDATQACMLDPALSTRTKRGYTYTAVASNPDTSVPPRMQSYIATASPVKYHITGTRYFCSNESFVVRAIDGYGASCDPEHSDPSDN